ncbi:junctional sarcoplasmic reticulum protein 1 [Hyaena hyaena]|uniref:junctional sarcoplasmic reticulum protein 1 n=1 Tax=Hyaena hyaena TaxID=95912 RepID=UPI001923F998|nr:junctional sarcoplasmic reticulum protein 1 [Hyaena hyaena]
MAPPPPPAFIGAVPGPRPHALRSAAREWAGPRSPRKRRRARPSRRLIAGAPPLAGSGRLQSPQIFAGGVPEPPTGHDYLQESPRQDRASPAAGRRAAPRADVRERGLCRPDSWTYPENAVSCRCSRGPPQLGLLGSKTEIRLSESVRGEEPPDRRVGKRRIREGLLEVVRAELLLRIPGLSDVSMATRALQELDGGLGSCQAGEDLSTLADPGPAPPPEDRVPAMPRLAEASSWPHDSQEPAAEGSPAGSVDARPNKTEKEPVTKVALGAGKERLKAGATPRSPARKKAQAAPPPQRPPPPPIPAPSEELPWGDLSLNKCLVLASLLALLGSAFQLCRDAVSGEADAPAPVPEPWAPPSSAPEPASPPPPPRPEAWVPPSGPPAPPVKAEKAAGEKRAPEEAPREERRRKEKPPKEPRLPKERPRREEKPRAAREPGGALPRRWAAREAGHRHRAQDPGDPGHRKRQAWGSPRRLDEDRPPGRRKQRAGKGRD